MIDPTTAVGLLAGAAVLIVTLAGLAGAFAGLWLFDRRLADIHKGWTLLEDASDRYAIERQQPSIEDTKKMLRRLQEIGTR